nr:uncharacterized protein LOC105489486 isoform X2 [Macaca nemestrina]
MECEDGLPWSWAARKRKSSPTAPAELPWASLVLCCRWSSQCLLVSAGVCWCLPGSAGVPTGVCRSVPLRFLTSSLLYLCLVGLRKSGWGFKRNTCKDQLTSCPDTLHSQPLPGRRKRHFHISCDRTALSSMPQNCCARPLPVPRDAFHTTLCCQGMLEGLLFLQRLSGEHSAQHA